MSCHWNLKRNHQQNNPTRVAESPGVTSHTLIGCSTGLIRMLKTGRNCFLTRVKMLIKNSEGDMLHLAQRLSTTFELQQLCSPLMPNQTSVRNSRSTLTSMLRLLKTALECQFPLLHLHIYITHRFHASTRLKTKYCEFNNDIGQTGASLKVKEIAEGSELSNKIGKCCIC